MTIDSAYQTMIKILYLLVILVVIYVFKQRKDEDLKFLNLVLIANLVVFFLPLAIAFVGSLPNGNMWSENGPGAVLWLYFIIIPLCSIVQIIWLVLIISHWKKNRKQNLDKQSK